MNVAESARIAYVDTSAIARVMLKASDSVLIVTELASLDGLVASQLMGTELRRVALRTNTSRDAERLLQQIAMVPLTPELLRAAESVEPASVTTLDAIHLVTALELYRAGEVESIVTFDRRLAAGAASHGLPVLAPTG